MEQAQVLQECVWGVSRKPANMSLTRGMCKDSLANRGEFLRSLGMPPEKLVCPHQVHGSRVYRVGVLDQGRGGTSAAEAVPETDALCTSEPGIPLGVMTADCLSVFFFDPATPSIGIAHAGWRGTREGICARTIQAMRVNFGADPSSLKVWFGPCIRACCYQVGEEFGAHFPLHVERREQGFYLDLIGENRQQAIEAGVRLSHIGDSGMCTICGPEPFFSHRRDGAECGRMLSVVMLP